MNRRRSPPTVATSSSPPGNSRAGRRAIWHRPLDTGAARMLDRHRRWQRAILVAGWQVDRLFRRGQAENDPARGRPGARRLRRAAGRDRNMGQGGCHSVRAWTDRCCLRGQRRTRRGPTRSPSLIARAGELRHIRPTSLPDGRHFVYLANHKEQLVAMLASVDGTDAVPLGTVQSHVVAGPSGLVVFVRDGTLLAQRLDVAAGRLTGDATVLAEGLTSPGGFFDGRFSTSPAMLVYLKVRANYRLCPNSESSTARERPSVPLVSRPNTRHRAFSPDGMRLAVARRESTVPARDIWVFDLVRDNRLRLTLDAGDDLAPQMVAGWAMADVQLQSARRARHLQATSVR